VVRRALAPVSRLRLAAGCALLVGLAFVQDPGFVVADTKFDLVAAPGEFLARALHLWDAEGAFGQVQNQAYGYLWPMGPFFALGDLLGSPGWAVQRGWQALVLCVAFVGAARLGRALGVRSDAAVLIAAAAYALSPRMLTVLGPSSIEVWPSALAPWVLLPLVVGAERGSPRRAAAWSAFAIAMVGGVNAAATFAVVPLGALWVLTRARGPRRRALLVWWPAFTALGTLWWLVPLLLLGAYSPPFLDYIETSAVTTFPTTLVDSLRGTSNWVPYVDNASRAGNDLVTTGYLAINSGVVLLVGLVGLLDRANPHRRFLALGAGVGLVMVTAGHVGAVDGWFAADLRPLLDGALSPLRNVHKFDPVIRLPLVLGMAWALDRVLSGDAVGDTVGDTAQQGRPRLERFAFVAMTLVTVAGAALPALQARVEPAGATLGVPDYWEEAADYLAAESDGGVALLAPGSTFGSYVWGGPRDEPMQWLADSRWAVRNVIPLTPPGNIRMLDEVERRLAEGDGSPGLTAALRRAGVEHLVVRNDLAPSSDVPDPVVVHEAIAESPGIDLVAEFGPELGGDAHLDTPGGRVVVNSGRQARYAAVEVFEVGGAPAASAGPATVVVGGPEDLPDLLDLGVVGDEPTVLGVDVPDGRLDAVPHDRVVLTDGLRDRERQFARIHDGYGPVRDPGYERRTTNPTPDYELGGTLAGERGDDVWRTTARLDGAVGLSASSSTSDPNALGGARVGEMPAAALDGDEGTAWVSGAGQEGPAWWRVEVDGTLPDAVTLVGGASATDNQSVVVETAAGTTERVRLGPGDRREVALPDGDSSWLRVEDASTAGGQVSLAEVELPGLEVARRLALPAVPDGWGAPDQVVLRTARDARTGCASVIVAVRCAADRAVPAEEPADLRRTVTLPEARSYDARLTVVPRAGRALDRLVQRGQFVLVTAASRPVPDPRAGVVAAVDGDPRTTWLADVDAEQPTYTVRWLDRRTVDGLTIETDADTAAAAPVRLELRWPGGGPREVEVVDGRASFPPIETRRLRITVLEAEPVNDLDFAARSRPVPVGISELTVDGVPYLPLGLSADPVELRCGSGPTLRVGDQLVPTAVTASPLQLARGVPVPAEPCVVPRVRLEAGETDVDALGTNAFDVASVVLDDAPTGVASTSEPAPLQTDGPTVRRVEVGIGDRIVALRENANPGWEADLDGRGLEPVVVDGWQQGFVLPDEPPAGSDGGTVEAVYAPDTSYRLGLLVGAAGVLLLGLVLLLTRRRWAGPDHPPVGTAPVPTVVVWGLTGLFAGTVAGWVGLLVAAAAAGVALALDRWSTDAAPLVLALPVLIATLPYLVTPWGSADGWAGNVVWPHYLALVPLVSALVLASDRREPREPREPARRFFSRSAGRSTTR
jgi:arabinofuranan 3-O-arabinosyltransferase